MQPCSVPVCKSHYITLPGVASMAMAGLELDQDETQGPDCLGNSCRLEKEGFGWL